MATDDDGSQQASRYLDYLPAIYQQDVGDGKLNFLARFLLAFEHVLTGLGDVQEPGLEEFLDGIVDPVDGALHMAGVHRYFDPGQPPLFDREREQAPKEFLEWLAHWVALTLRADLGELRLRDLIAKAVPLYRLRGTKQGLEELVRIYTVLGVTVNELNTPFQIGAHSTVGVDTILDGGGPHFFRVLLRLPTKDPRDPAEQRTYRELATAIIDMEKPAHSYYNRGDQLDVQTPALWIGVYSKVGVDTLLGTIVPDLEE